MYSSFAFLEIDSFHVRRIAHPTWLAHRTHRCWNLFQFLPPLPQAQPLCLPFPWCSSFPPLSDTRCLDFILDSSDLSGSHRSIRSTACMLLRGRMSHGTASRSLSRTGRASAWPARASSDFSLASMCIICCPMLGLGPLQVKSNNEVQFQTSF